MRATAFALLAMGATLISAQGSVPSCAMSCISQALPANCNLDPKCICADASFISTISCCVSIACDTAGQQAALSYAQSLCVPAGVTNLPTAASCAGSSTASATSAAAAATASGSSASSRLSSASSALSSVTSSASSVAALASSSQSSAASSASSSGSAAAASASSSASQSTNAAPTLGPLGKGFAGVALGVLALL